MVFVVFFLKSPQYYTGVIKYTFMYGLAWPSVHGLLTLVLSELCNFSCSVSK